MCIRDRLGAALVARLIEDSVLPYVQTVSTTGQQMMAALAECESRGVRGGAVYDWLHLAAARQAGAQSLVTLDRRDFQALSRPCLLYTSGWLPKTLVLYMSTFQPHW